MADGPLELSDDWWLRMLREEIACVILKARGQEITPENIENFLKNEDLESMAELVKQLPKDESA